MILLIDIGNSRIKAALFAEGDIQPCFAAAYEKDEIGVCMDSHLDKDIKPARVLVSSVAGNKVNRELSLYAEQQWSLEIEFASVASEAAGVINGYRSSETLGVDRWSALVAGWSCYRSALVVVDCGTALTVDLVSDGGLHLGGFILPSLELMSSSLGASTEQISADLEHSHASIEPGDSTASCIANGALAAIISLVESSFKQLSPGQENQCHCVITGGNAEQILESLSIKFDHDPYLVLRGVAILLEAAS